jgi:predicted CoA-binding protein
VSNIIKIFVLLSVLSLTIIANAKYNDWYYKIKLLPKIQEQSIINQQLHNKLIELQETVDYVEFSLGVNNKLLEEVLMEQIQRKGDE